MHTHTQMRSLCVILKTLGSSWHLGEASEVALGLQKGTLGRVESPKEKAGALPFSW